MSKEKKGGAAAIAALEAAGVEVVFGIPGVHTLELYDALHRSSIRHVLARHEQGAGFMADGYARATGKPGVCLIITGPGVTNVATPVGEAFTDSSPVVVLSSNVERPYLGRMRGNLHDIADQSGVMRGMTKRTTTVTAVEQVAETVYDAVIESNRGRPRPVHVEIPIDVLSDCGISELPSASPPQPRAPRPDDIARAVEMLAHGRRPLVYVGGGAMNAGAAISELAELLGAPVISSIMGKGVVSDEHPYALGHAWNPWGEENPADELLRSADVALVIGSKLGAQETRYWQMPLPEKLIRVDIDPVEATLNYGPPKLGIIADARLTAEALLAGLKSRSGVSHRIATEEVAVYRQRIHGRGTDSLFAHHIAALRAAIPRDGIIVQDMTMMSYRMNDRYPVYEPRTYLFPSGYGTLGFSLPAAIGAKIGRPDRAVVAVAGDGGYQFTMQELATAIQFELPIPIVIFNDSTYTAVKEEMVAFYGGRTLAVDLINPDYVKLADAYGIPGIRVEEPADLERAVVDALGRRTPTIIDVPIPSAADGV